MSDVICFPTHVHTCVQSLEVECMALEPKLHEVKASYDLLIDLSLSEDGGSVWEGEDEPLKDKEDAEKRYQDLLDKLHSKKELLNAELSKCVKLEKFIAHPSPSPPLGQSLL